ncbi:MAG: hypothetical protein KTR31_28410 [Myxococcales bacterium]|nr:hypothetical protein [Myxococcales bacterium]
MRHVLCVALGTLTGCGSLTYYGSVADDGERTNGIDPITDPLETTEETTDAPPSAVEIRIDDLNPTYGSNASGQWVVLNGSFDESTTVSIGGLAANVLQHEPDELVVELPTTTSTGYVDVVASSPEGTDTLTDAFQYWADATGEAGTIGTVDFFQQVGDYWTDPPTNYSSGWFAFSTGTNWTLWQEYTTSQGSCVFDHTYDADPQAITTGATQVRFSNQAGGFTLDEGVEKSFGADWYTNDDLNAVLQTGAVYDLDPVAGPDFPSFDLPTAIEMAAPFQVTSPNLHGDNLPTTDASISLSWSGSGGDYVLIWILRQYLFEGQFIDDGVVSCAVPDTGSFTVPAALWNTWFAGDVLHIQVGRAHIDDNVLPHNGADSRIAGVYWVWGGAVTD